MKLLERFKVVDVYRLKVGVKRYEERRGVWLEAVMFRRVSS